MSWLHSLYRKFWVLPKVHRTYKNLSLVETFSNIYSSKAWGNAGELPFSSGSGSAGHAADEYCRNVIDFIRNHNIESVADLGCGDFRVGRKISSETNVRYFGVDIVPAVIERNTREFGSDRISFQCADLTTGPLPSAQLCLVRQVLQHLSNAEISAVLAQISQYPFALIAEHVPKIPKSYNKDKPHGPDIRVYYGSGVYVEKAPFSRSAELMWETELDEESLLRTVLLKTAPSR